jgi:hypothetical protein
LLWNKTFLTIYVLLDAINESLPDGTNGIKSVKKSNIVELFRKLGTSSTSHVVWKIMTASRDLDLPPEDIQHKCTIQLAEHNHDDVGSMIESKISEIRAVLDSRAFHVREYEDAMEQFHQRLRCGHNGIILWVKGVVDLIKARMNERTFTLEDLVTFLHKPPRKLEELYEAMITQLKERKSTMANDIIESNNWLRWGVLASVNLSIPEFKDAVAICGFHAQDSFSIQRLKRLRIVYEGPQDVRTALALRGGGFLELKQRAIERHDPLSMKVDAELRPPEHEVQVAHESVRIFLTSETALPFQIQVQSGHFFLARMCTRYLILMIHHGKDTDEAPTHADGVIRHLEQLPLLPYVFEYFQMHLDVLGEDCETEQLAQDLDALYAAFGDCSELTASLLLVWANYQKSEATQTSHRLWEKMLDVIGNRVPSAARNSQQNAESLLVRAASVGDSTALKSLFASGVMHQPTANSQLQREVLKYASHRIKTDRQICTVISSYINVNLSRATELDGDATGADTSGKVEEDGRTLYEAVRLELPRVIVEKLGEDDKSLRFQDDAGLTPLHLAAAKGLSSIVQLLIEAGADFNARDSFERTPLIHAVQNKREETSQLLLEHGVLVNTRDSDGNTARSIASQQGHESLVQLLAYFGAEPEPSFALKSPQSTRWMLLPLEQNPYFINRPELLKQIEMSFQTSCLVALTGLGGIG